MARNTRKRNEQKSQSAQENRADQSTANATTPTTIPKALTPAILLPPETGRPVCTGALVGPAPVPQTDAVPLTYGVIDRLALASGITTDVVVSGTWVPLRVAVTIWTTRSTVRVRVHVVRAEEVASAPFWATSTCAEANEAALSAVVAIVEKRMLDLEVRMDPGMSCPDAKGMVWIWSSRCAMMW